MHKISTALAGCALLVAAPVTAAATLHFELFGLPTNNDGVFDVDDSSPPSSIVPGQSFGLIAYYPGDSFGHGIFFYSSALFGGFSVQHVFGYNGAQLYSGDEAHPQFRLGTFNLTVGAPFSGTQQLIITRNIDAVPEPTTWAMMITGFGMAGTAARRRQSLRTVRL